jgi:signal transduction histidine kinase
MLDEAGLEPTVEWYLPVVERQTGIGISYEKSGIPFAIHGNAAVHIYRVLQEALNNVARHSGTKRAWVRLRFAGDHLQLEVEDRGSGFTASGPRQGIGLVAMRERAELLGGRIAITRPADGGTLVRMTVPRERLEPNV